MTCPDCKVKLVPIIYLDAMRCPQCGTGYSWTSIHAASGPLGAIYTAPGTAK